MPPHATRNPQTDTFSKNGPVWLPMPNRSDRVANEALPQNGTASSEFKARPSKKEERRMAGLCGDPFESEEDATVNAGKVEPITTASNDETLMPVFGDPHGPFPMTGMEQPDSQGQHRGAVNA